VPPSRYLNLGVPTWGETDFLLTQALEIHDRMLCPGGCGQYADEAHSGEWDGGFSVDERQCHACAAREQWEREHRGEDRPAGTLLSVVKQQKATRRIPGASRPRG
jgi:hypothetical protein